MVPTGHPAPFEDSKAVPTSNFMRSNSGLLSGSQGAFPSPRNQLGNMNMLGNMSNVSSLLQQAGAVSGISGSRSAQLVVMDNGVESNPLSAVGNGMGCNVPSASLVSSSQKAKANAMATAKFQGQQISSLNMNHMLTDLQTNSQIDPNYFQHFQQSMNQFNATSNPQHQLPQQVQRGQLMRAGLGAVGMVKQEPQMTNDQLPQQSQAVIQSPGAVKLEPQQLPSMRSLPPPVKTEPQNSDSSLFSPHQQQQQQSTPVQLLHQQRLAQIQQQQQITKAIPQQRVPVQQQFQAQNLHTRSPIKPNYEPGTCAHRLTHYMYKQQHRPEDNNIEYWRNFVAEFFSPNAKKKWCVSLYGSGRQTTEVFPQDIWHCEICKRKPGRGFEATVEVLPRLFKLKYESGTIEELLYVDMPNEYQNSSGQIVLDYAKAIQQSVFEQLRVVRDGQLRLVFSQDLKICSWEFCARRHEEFIPRRLLIPQVNQLGTAAQKYQAAVQCAPTNISVSELQNNCNMFIAPVRQLAKTLDVPMVNDFGYSKRFIRCLQISEVVNSMTDLIDFGRESGTGPMESLAKFPRITGSFSGFINGQPPPKSEDQQNGDDCVQAQASGSNGLSNVNNTMNRSTVNQLVYQNSMNPRHQNSSRTSQYIGSSSSSQLPSPSSSTTTLPQTQQTIPSPIPSPLPAVSSNSLDAVNESKGSVQKIIQDMMMTSSQLGGGSGGGIMCLNDLKPPANNNVLIGNGGFGGLGFENGIRGGLRNTNNNNNNNSSLTTMNGRIGMMVPREQSMMNQQHEPINGLLGSVNGFNNLPFDWKPSP